MSAQKPVHTIVLDTGPIIKGDPSISSLRAQSEQIVTLPSVIAEIKDEATRSHFQTSLLPFLVLRSPKESSVKIISDFARRTGDLSVLSRVDIQLLALTYDLECERNGGDWRLRKTPGEKRINGPNPNAVLQNDESASTSNQLAGSRAPSVDDTTENLDLRPETAEISTEATLEPGSASTTIETPKEQRQTSKQDSTQPQEATVNAECNSDILSKELTNVQASNIEDTPTISSLQISDASQDENTSDSDSEGWITPSNLKKKQDEDYSGGATSTPEPKVLQVAILTSDYAMQNVALQMNLNLLSPSLSRVKQLKTYVLRCHACFNVVKDTSKQFCPRCGKPTLTRVSCSTSANGEFKLHLKKNMQWNTRGDRYSVPKPVAGAANGRVKGGGKGGWGNDLILAEDQKEYQRAVTEQKRMKQRDFMDEDYLPGILSGNRSNGAGKIKVGAGKNVNSRKRK